MFVYIVINSGWCRFWYDRNYYSLLFLYCFSLGGHYPSKEMKETGGEIKLLASINSKISLKPHGEKWIMDNFIFMGTKVEMEQSETGRKDVGKTEKCTDEHKGGINLL